MRRLQTGRFRARPHARRDLGRLEPLASADADDIVQLTADSDAAGKALAAAAADTDIVIDYLWGSPAQQAIMALLTARSDRGRALNWIQVGAIAGPAIELPSVALRSANLRAQGSGQGSVGPADYLAELASLVDANSNGAITATANTVPLTDVEQSGPGKRLLPNGQSWCHRRRHEAQSTELPRHVVRGRE